jgi:lipopolysaccharide transport system permease protein
MEIAPDSERLSPLRESQLPEEPVVVIEPSKWWVAADVRDLWSHRGLLYFLVWRDLKVRYKQTLLGVAWVVLQPLFMTLIFTLVFGRLVRIPTGKVPYALFAYSGVMLWTFFSGAISTTGNSLVGNANLITKVYFPRIIIPVATIIARLADLAVVLIILVPLMVYYRVGATPRLLAAPIPILLIALLALGFGLWTSAVNVKYRDVNIALPVLIQLWMFASPVLYGMNVIPKDWQLLFSINPLVGIMEGFRAALFGTDFNWPAILISTGFTILLLLYGTYTFQRRQKTFADII